MFRCSSFGLGLVLIGLTHAARINVNKDLEPVVAAGDAAFVAPAFDELARVRAPELTGLSAPVVKQAMALACTSTFSCKPSGASKKQWDEMVLKVITFDNICKGAGGDVAAKGELRYKAFLQLPKDPAWTRQQSANALQLSDTESSEQVKEWLTKKKGYWTKWATQLANDFYENAPSGDEKLNSLENFVALDQNHGIGDTRDGTLGLAEVMDYIGAGALQESLELKFPAAARVQAEDFTALGLPDLLTDSIMATAGEIGSGGPGIDLTTYEKLDLQNIITEFVRLDTVVLTSAHESVKKNVKRTDGLNGALKFYQFADVLPNLAKTMDSVTHSATVQVQGADGVEKSVTVQIPTVAEVTGVEDRKEIASKDVEGWLERDMGIQNANAFVGLFTGNKHQYAKKLADNAIAWADGRSGTQNGRVAGGEWTDVAGRLALFVTMDTDKDGKVEFQEAYPYLKKWLQNGAQPSEGESEEVVSTPQQKAVDPWGLSAAIAQARGPFVDEEGKEAAKAALAAAMGQIETVMEEAEGLKRSLQ